jgi:hypothetical protein
MEMMTFNGNNVDEVKAFAGDACEIKIVFDNNSFMWRQYVVVKTVNGLVRLKPYDVLIKDVDGGIHLCKE